VTVTVSNAISFTSPENIKNDEFKEVAEMMFSKNDKTRDDVIKSSILAMFSKKDTEVEITDYNDATSTVSFDLTITRSCEESCDDAKANSINIVEASVTKLNESVEGGVFVATLKENAKEQGVDTLANVSIKEGSFKSEEVVITVVVYSHQPSSGPSSFPTKMPSFVPSSFPSLSSAPTPTSQTKAPTHTNEPSSGPSSSFVPSLFPSQIPSFVPSSFPSQIPSFAPSSFPSQIPSFAPSSLPSRDISSVPSLSSVPTPTSQTGLSAILDILQTLLDLLVALFSFLN